MNTRNCPICLHNATTLLFENTMAAVGGFDMSYSVGCCQKCAFVYANELADDDTFQAYYKSVSKYDVAKEIASLDRLRTEAAVNICRDKIAYDSYVVDLGCGFGALLSGFKDAGWTNLGGIDPAPNSVDRASALFGLDNIYRSTIAEAHNVLQLDQADLVCITSVLEHLPRVRDDLTALLGKLKVGCKILVEVPALERFSGLSGEPFGEFSLEHIQFFSAESLTNLFAALGARPVAFEILDLPEGDADSLFGLFEVMGSDPASFRLLREDRARIASYIHDSKQRMNNALSRVPTEPMLIYGAGSHTARLLPALKNSGQLESQVLAVVDNNPNLQNKAIGQYVVRSPAIIGSLPDAPILISSFRFQNEIATRLRVQYPNRLVLLYDQTE